MSHRLLLATFDHEEDILAATTEVHRQGYKIVDVFTPYAIHGLDRAMGLRPSRLTWVCFVCGMMGVVGMLWFEHWTAAIDWAINVGGKPWNSLPSDAPPAFELGVLLAGFGSVFALFAASRLYPGKRPRPAIDRVTDDRFVLVLDERDAAFDAAGVESLLSRFNVLELEEQVVAAGDHR